MDEFLYLKKRIAMLEDVVERLGTIIGLNLPAIQPHLAKMGEEWTNDGDALWAEYHEGKTDEE